jgi:hypothetical protein
MKEKRRKDQKYALHAEGRGFESLNAHLENQRLTRDRKSFFFLGTYNLHTSLVLMGYSCVITLIT